MNGRVHTREFKLAIARQLAEPLSAEAKIAELERFCGQLALENALLKKALGKLPLNSGTR